jgi:hypothetical protein
LAGLIRAYGLIGEKAVVCVHLLAITPINNQGPLFFRRRVVLLIDCTTNVWPAWVATRIICEFDHLDSMLRRYSNKLEAGP